MFIYIRISNQMNPLCCLIVVHVFTVHVEGDKFRKEYIYSYTHTHTPQPSNRHILFTYAEHQVWQMVQTDASEIYDENI